HDRASADVARGMGARLSHGLGHLLLARSRRDYFAARRGQATQRRQHPVPDHLVQGLLLHREDPPAGERLLPQEAPPRPPLRASARAGMAVLSQIPVGTALQAGAVGLALSAAAWALPAGQARPRHLRLYRPGAVAGG